MDNKSVPEPLADDPDFFQILIATALADPKDEVHLTFTANKMKLDKVDVYDIAWLTGGGTECDDWDNPVMQVANSTEGAANGVKFTKTYDIKLSELPHDSSKEYRVLKVPYRDPSDASYSLAGSGHLTITINSSAVMQINENKDTTGKVTGYSFALPSPIADGAGGQSRWDFVELNCATPQVSSKNVCFINTTNVDMYALGVTIKGRDAGGTIDKFGLDLDKTDAFSSLLANLKALPSDYSAGLLKSTEKGKFLRYLAPDHSFSSTSKALDKSIKDGYDKYKTEKLTFEVSEVQYEATTDASGALVFSKPDLSPAPAISINQPTTKEAIDSRGPLNTGSTSDAKVQGAMKFIDAAINRGVFDDASVWYNSKKWYPEGGTYNLYCKTLHDAFIDGACYGFSYDDVPGEGVVSAPAIGSCTSMSLMITG